MIYSDPSLSTDRLSKYFTEDDDLDSVGGCLDVPDSIMSSFNNMDALLEHYVQYSPYASWKHVVLALVMLRQDKEAEKVEKNIC